MLFKFATVQNNERLLSKLAEYNKIMNVYNFYILNFHIYAVLGIAELISAISRFRVRGLPKIDRGISIKF